MGEPTVPDPLEPLTPDVVARLQAQLDGPQAAVRAQTREALCRLDLEKADGMEREAYRDAVLGWLREIASSGAGARSFPADLGGRDDPAGSIASFQTLAHGDLSLLVKVGVQFGLFGGAVHRLGTERHHREPTPGAGGVTVTDERRGPSRRCRGNRTQSKRRTPRKSAAGTQ